MKNFALTCFLLLATSVFAQQVDQPFRTRIFNNEYRVFMVLNLYDADVVVPGQEVFGTMEGYLSKEGTNFCWLVVSSQMKSERKATLLMANDYGSEDLEAELTLDNDSTYTLKQLSGSALKVVNKGKWQKLPRILTFTREKSL